MSTERAQRLADGKAYRERQEQREINTIAVLAGIRDNLKRIADVLESFSTETKGESASLNVELGFDAKDLGRELRPEVEGGRKP